MLFQVHALTKKFGKHIAVDHVSFDIEEGEALGLVGESGSGKTTIGRMLLKLLPHDAGEIVYSGSAPLKKFREECQIIFQDPMASLNPRIRIGDAIGEPIHIHKLLTASKIPERVNELLESVGLKKDYATRFPHELSGGERQRVCIARALATQPKFIVCDEPVSALDVSVQAQILNLLIDLKERYGLTYLFISHDLAVVSVLCDRVMVMERGKIVDTGLLPNLFLTPSKEYTRKLIDSIPAL